MRMLRSSIQSTPSVRDDEVPRLRAHGLAYRPVEPNYDGHCRRKGYARSEYVWDRRRLGCLSLKYRTERIKP
jgi:hypothetical protein